MTHTASLKETTEPTPVADSAKEYRKAIICSLAAALSFTLMLACVKLLEQKYPVGEILFARSFFSFFLLIPMIVRGCGMEVFHTKHPGKHLTRGLVGLISAFLCFAAIVLLPLSDATPLFHTAPIVTTILAVPLLKEKVTWKKGLAIFVGFLGVLLIVQPRGEVNLAGALMALGSAITGGYVGIELNRLGKTEKSLTIVVYFMILCAIAGALTMFFECVLPGMKDAILMITMGIVGGVGQMFMTAAYKRAPASLVAPMAYSSLVWAAMLDAMLWGKIPPMTTVCGALVIACAGVFLIRQKHDTA